MYTIHYIVYIMYTMYVYNSQNGGMYVVANGR